MNRAANVEAMSPKDKVLWDLWGLIMRHFDGDEEVEGQIDAEIQKLGYRKVVECGKCKWWADSGDKMWGTCKKPYESADITTVNYCCSKGEPKEVI